MTGVVMRLVQTVVYCIAVHGVSASLSAGPCYDVEYVYGPTCPIFGPTFVSPEDIAPDGTIVGGYENCADGDVDEAFIWKPGQSLFTIPRFPSVVTQYATAINGRGQVALGVYLPLSGVGTMAWVYTIATGEFVPLGIPPGGTHSIPYGLNDTGSVAGEWGNSLIGPNPEAFVYHKSTLIDLTPLLSGPRARAFDINNSNQAVGWTGEVLTNHFAFIWDNGKIINIGPIPDGINSTTRSINELGQVAVTGSTPNPSGAGTVGRAYIWEGGRWTHLGLLPEYSSCSASFINDIGHVMGTCTNPGVTGSARYIWHDGVMYDINQRLVNANGVTIATVHAINNAGQIAARGNRSHPVFGPSQVIVRLVPRPPQPADLNDDCRVGPADLMMMIQSWGPVTERTPTPAADIDQNQIINGIDLAILLGAWG